MIKLFLTFILIFLTTPCFAVTRFVVRVNIAATEDYNTITLAEAAMDNAGNLTDATVKTGSWDGCTGTCTSASIIDAEAVTWDAGASTGTLIHLTTHSNQYLIDVTTGILDDNDIIDDGDGNSFTINGTPDSAIISIQPYNDDGVLNENFSLSGFTTNSTNYVEVSPPTTERHTGVEGTGVVINGGTATNVINVGGINPAVCFNCVIEFLEVTGGSPGATGAGINCSTVNSQCIIRNNIVHDIGSTTNPSRGITVNRRANVNNNIIYDIWGNGIEEVSGFAANMNVDNNTVWNFNIKDAAANRGIKFGGSTTGNARNNLVFEGTGTTGQCYQLSSVTGAKNGSSDTTGTTGFQSLIVGDELTNPVSTSSADLHLKSTSTVIDDGNNLGSTNGVNKDIDGYDRISNGVIWDIGADEFVAATGGATRRLMLIQ